MRRPPLALLLVLALGFQLSGWTSARAQAFDEALLPSTVREALGAEALALPDVPPLAPSLGDGPIDAATYRLGPGDELTVRYRGRTTATHRLLVNPEGDVYLPDVGRIVLLGKTLEEGRVRVVAAARKILNNVAVDVDLTRVRAFKVSVTGQVARPGVYAASGATRVFEVLRLAGGLRDSAAIRDIRLVDNRTGDSRSVDLLPFLLNGGPPTSNPYLPDGATVVVPRRVRMASLAGALVHSGVFDLPAAGTTIGQAIELLGLEPDAATDRLELTRRGSDGRIERKSGSLSELGSISLEHGDHLNMPRSGSRRMNDLVTLEGEVGFPGTYALESDAITLADLLERAGGVAPGAVRSRILLARPALSDTLTPDARRLAPFPNVPLNMTEKEQIRARGLHGYRAVIVDLSDPTDKGPFLAAGDRIVVPRRGAYVEVAGRVRRPGFYPYRAGASAESYIASAGGWADRADKGQTRIGAGPGDNFRVTDDAGPPAPGDQIWVPERIPRSSWENIRDAVVILGQLATVVLLIDQLSN
ncbi:MAG: SLBB domain-containing protein [Candidatus Eisenbacteria bacterium]|nr:SLBB domain-containing protein [Candidatus Eisenbacteria bacterium]